MEAVLFVAATSPSSSLGFRRAYSVSRKRLNPLELRQHATCLSQSRANIRRQASPYSSRRVEVITSRVRPPSRTSVKDVLHYFNYATYALLPVLTAAAQPTLAEDAPAADPLSFIKGLQGNPLFDQILGTIVLVLMVYATIGAIIISIDGIIIKNNDARHKEWVRKRVNGEPYPKTIWSPEIDTEFPPKAGSTSSSTSGLNREQRRIEKKLQIKEDKEKKRREARAATRKKDTKT